MLRAVPGALSDATPSELALGLVEKLKQGEGKGQECGKMRPSAPTAPTTAFASPVAKPPGAGVSKHRDRNAPVRPWIFRLSPTPFDFDFDTR